jgi:hypothetical protein
MSEANTFSFVVSILQAIGGIAVAVALYLAFKNYRFGSNKWQFELAKQIQDDIIGLNRELATVDDKDDQAKQLLYERLFNSLEWLGFLINENQLSNNKVRLYFKDMVIKYFENTFSKTDYITDEQRKNKDEYPEFKKLYEDYKQCKYD